VFRLAPKKPETHYLQGLLSAKQQRLDEAETSYRRSLELRPGHADTLLNLGNTLLDLGRVEEAATTVQELVRLQPEHPDAHKNLGIFLLRVGRWQQGWPEYEWRWRCKEQAPRPFRQPLWDGSPLAGGTILLHAEQGLGDTIQFIRYAPLVKQRGGRVVVECQPALLPLLARCPGIDQLVASGKPLPVFDVHAPLLNLPGIFRTTPATVPASVPYLFADDALVQRWRDELRSVPGFRVGIVWQGSRKHKEDRRRSVRLERFAPLAAIPGVRLISLQKGPGSEQLADQGGRFEILDLAGRLDERSGPFMDTAAVLKCLDLVITVDTAGAHLAGALGVPVWVALAFAADWRWLLDRDDSPWYPTMRLFRQKQPGDWDGVFQRMAQELAKAARPTRAIRVEVALGELIDKITILEIKNERITDSSKLQNVRTELAELTTERDRLLPPSDELARLTAGLKEVNAELWRIEDEIRDCERRQDFGPAFIALARSVYHQNDRRAALKRRINDLLGSRIVEEKSYRPYQ
jgi:hypothetical protein